MTESMRIAEVSLSVCCSICNKYQNMAKVYKIFQRKFVIIFLPINFNICFGCSKEPSQLSH